MKTRATSEDHSPQEVRSMRGGDILFTTVSPGPRMVPSTQLSPQCLLKERLVYQLVASLMERNASLTARFLGVELCHVLKKKKRVFKL